VNNEMRRHVANRKERNGACRDLIENPKGTT
jgi:hypothetical protein